LDQASMQLRKGLQATKQRAAEPAARAKRRRIRAEILNRGLLKAGSPVRAEGDALFCQ
jgi:hypothetical protein